MSVQFDLRTARAIAPAEADGARAGGASLRGRERASLTGADVFASSLGERIDNLPVPVRADHLAVTELPVVASAHPHLLSIGVRAGQEPLGDAEVFARTLVDVAQA
jgi:hypothetical protein